ncbi:MAG: ABC transporter ATP-binding protein [Thermodesulfobacteriota bacterium]
MTGSNLKAILEIQGLKTHFRTRRGLVPAVDGVDLTLYQGETLGLVGESGCGKSVTALSVLRLTPRPQGFIAAGRIIFNGRDLVKVAESEMKRIRGNNISMIFQEPMTSLNPVYPVGYQIAEVLKKHRRLGRREARLQAVDLLGQVGLPDPGHRVNDYPHQLSGGMRQRVMIAMALACHPQIMIADEPTTALDVTIQAQILDLMARLKRDIGMSILLITHDLGVVAETCRRVAVMYAGRVVEAAGVRELFAGPRHPYTLGLFQSLPQMAGRTGDLNPIPGLVPDLLSLPPGCAFQDRCFQAAEDCRRPPPWLAAGPDHWTRCHRPLG